MISVFYYYVEYKDDVKKALWLYRKYKEAPLETQNTIDEILKQSPS